jgi:hypothetical protein
MSPAMRLSNPYLPPSLCDILLPPCPTDGHKKKCGYCNGSLVSQFLKVIKNGVQSVSFDVFLGKNATRNISLRVILSLAPSSNTSHQTTSCLAGRQLTNRSLAISGNDGTCQSTIAVSDLLQYNSIAKIANQLDCILIQSKQCGSVEYDILLHNDFGFGL